MHLAVSYLDRVLDKGYAKAREEVTAATCFLLASKFNEVDENIPLISDLIKTHASLSIYELSSEALLQTEIELVSLLEWDLDVIIPLHFINNLVQQGIVFSNDLVKRDSLLLEVRVDSYAIAEFAMKTGRFHANFLPSEIAFAVVVCARRLHKIEPGWNKAAFEYILKAAGQQSVEEFHERVKKCGQLLTSIVKAEGQKKDQIEIA